MGQHDIVSYDQRRDAPEAGRLVVFNHIMKCGGISLLAILADHFGAGHYPHKVDHYTDWLDLSRGGFTARTDPTLSLGGHAAGGIESLFPEPRHVFYVTQLREPFALCLSLYRYSRMHFAPPMSMQDYVHQGYPSNLMVKTLADGDLELAKDRLEGLYFNFSLLECFDQGLGLLRHNLGLPQADYQGRNASSADLVPVEYDEQVKDSFYSLNAMDVALYEHARRLFARRLADFEAEAGAFSHGRARGGVVELATSRSLAEPILKMLGEGSLTEAVQAMEELPEDKIPRRELAKYHARLGDPDRGLEWLRDGMSRQPWLLWHEMQICERVGRLELAFELASSMLEQVRPMCTTDPEDAYVNRFAYDALVTMSRLAYLLGDRARAKSAQSEANDVLPSRMWPRYDGKPLREHVPLLELPGQNQRVLVMRFGPLPVLETFTGAVRDRAWHMDILIQPSVAGDIPARDFETVHLLPSERFSFHNDAGRLPQEVVAGDYSAVVVICNDQDLLTYEDVFRLCARISTAKTWIYPMSSSLVSPPQMKIFDVEEVLAHLPGETTRAASEAVAYET